MHATYIHPPTQTRFYCARRMYAPHTPKHAQIVHASYMHPPIQTRAQSGTICVYIYVCATYMHAHIDHAAYMHAHIVHATYMHTSTQTRAYCARYIHDDTCTHPPKHPPTLTCAYCARYMHAQTHPNIRMLCTIHACTNSP